jgi:hypothetical protein
MTKLLLKSLKKSSPKNKKVSNNETANSLTNKIINHLSMIGFCVWRQNTIGVFDVKKQVFRKNKNTKKGVSDIIGFHKLTATFIAVEIKIGNDKLSLHQSTFLKDVEKAKGISLVVKSFDDYLEKMK